MNFPWNLIGDAKKAKHISDMDPSMHIAVEKVIR